MRPLIVSLLLALLLAPGCGGTSRPPSAPPAVAPAPPPPPPAPTPPPAPSARAVLRLYLYATFAGHHGVAWSSLTQADKAAVPRDTYIEREAANARIRERLGNLGPVLFHIVRVDAHGDSAVAAVRIQTPLGVSIERFILRREERRWRIAYGDSWADTEQ